MEKYLSILQEAQLFSGVSEAELRSMLSCLGTIVRTYEKGAYIFRQGDPIEHITLLAEGELLIQRDDHWGNRSIISHIAPGDMFGEAYLSPNGGTILNDVAAAQSSTVFFFDVRRLMATCPSACPFHTRVVQNLFFAIAEKNRSLVQKQGHMSRRTTREKLLSYLSEEARRQQSDSFTIPFNRQQLADFLSVDRSAMSSELSRMRSEGLLTFNRSHFTLL